MLEVLDPRRGFVNEHISYAEKTIDVVQLRRPLIYYLVRTCKYIVPTEALSCGILPKSWQLRTHAEINQCELPSAIMALPRTNVLRLEVAVRVSELVHFLQAWNDLAEHCHHKTCSCVEIRNLFLPLLKARSAVSHEYFASVLPNLVAEQARKSIVFRASGQNLLQIDAFLHFLSLLNICEDLELSENPLEGAALVLFEDDAHSHMRISAEEDLGLCRLSTYLVYIYFIVEINDFVFSFRSHLVVEVLRSYFRSVISLYRK